MIPTIDDGFISRVYKTSAYVWLFGALVAWMIWGLTAAVGWTIGSAVSVGLLRSLEVTVRRYFVPGFAGAQSSLTRASVVKLAAIIVVLVGVILIGKLNFAFIIAFCVGALLAQSVIVLKIIGILLRPQRRK